MDYRHLDIRPAGRFLQSPGDRDGSCGSDPNSTPDLPDGPNEVVMQLGAVGVELILPAAEETNIADTKQLCSPLLLGAPYRGDLGPGHIGIKPALIAIGQNAVGHCHALACPLRYGPACPEFSIVGMSDDHQRTLVWLGMKSSHTHLALRERTDTHAVHTPVLSAPRLADDPYQVNHRRPLARPPWESGI
jgi:hypothetical protein